MSGVDSRIVTMKFDNAKFEHSVKTTMTSVGNLKKSLDFGSAQSSATKNLGLISSALGKFGLKNPFANTKKGAQDLGNSLGKYSKLNPFSSAKKSSDDLQGSLGRFSRLNPFSHSQQGVKNLQDSVNKFSMSTMEGGITHISGKFIALSTVAITALSNITNKAVNAGGRIAKSLTIDPIMGGFHEYETNLNSIQTVLANTKDQGTNLKDVNDALGKLNTYSDKTIYNFSEMAKNIGTFTAAGVDLDTATSSIKGIANLAATSGSNSEQASTAMYQLSQAISSGKVGLQDWNSVVNAGMGGAVFQKALVRTAQNMGTIGKSSAKISGPMKKLTINGSSFRESIMAKPGQKSWLSSDVLTNTLKQMSGEMTTAQLKAQGFDDTQIKAIKSTAKMGVEAATKVKTVTQLMDTLKESVGSGWTKSFQTIFGNFDEAKTLFTSVSNTLGGLVSNTANARNKILGDWKKMGGRTILIESIGNIFKAVMKVVGAFKDAFHDIFPPATGKSLLGLTKTFERFTKAIMPSTKTIDNLKSIFRGVFAAFDIGIQVVKGIIGVFKDLFDAMGGGSGGFLDFTGNIGDFIVSIDKGLKKGTALTGFFTTLKGVLRVPVAMLKAVAQWIGHLFGGFDSDKANGVESALGKVQDRLSPLTRLGHSLAGIWHAISKTFGRVLTALAPLGETVKTAFSKIGDAIGDAFSGKNFSKVLDTINTGLLAGIILMLKNFVGGDLLKVDLGGGIMDSVSGAFNQLTGTLKSMQAQIKADTLMKIAIAMGLLTVSIVALSLIDSKKLTKSLAGVAVSFGMMQVALAKLSSSVSLFGTAKLPVITASLIMLAGALVILSIAVTQLSKLNLEQLAKGLGAVAVLLIMMIAAAKPLSANSAGMIRAGAGMLVLALGLKVMASAVKDFAALSWKDMIKGFAGLTSALVLLSGTMRLMPKNMVGQAAALAILGVALKIIASVMNDFSKMSLNAMVQGFVGLGTSLMIIAGAMHLMPKGMILQAVGLLMVADAIKGIAKALKVMGGMSAGEIAKGLITLGGALLILAGGLNLMNGTLMGSASLLVAAAALAILTPILVVLGSMSWESIAKGMVAIAATFAILGAAGLLLAPVTPVIMGLGAAMLMFGAGLALVGVGALAFAAAFGIVVGAGTLGIAVLNAMLTTIINAIPGAIKSFGQGVVEFAKVIGKGAGAFGKAFGKVLGSILGAIARNAPKVAHAFSALLHALLSVLVDGIPAIASAGLQMLLGLLTAINKNIYRIVTVAGNIIVHFLNALGKQLPRIVNAGYNMIINLMNGLARAINKNQSRMNTAAINLATAIINGLINGLRQGAGAVWDAAVNVAKSALNGALKWLGIKSPSREFHKVGMYSSQGLALGLTAYSGVVEKSAAGVADAALQTIGTTMSRIPDAVSSEIDMSPTITPVLDLTKMANDASAIGGILSTKPINAGVSFGQAASISSETQAAADAAASTNVATPQTVVELTQNNYSPKTLSAVEIYRQTRNQLSLAKEALKA
jgi:tape measure domain-containing protein